MDFSFNQNPFYRLMFEVPVLLLLKQSILSVFKARKSGFPMKLAKSEFGCVGHV